MSPPHAHPHAVVPGSRVLVADAAGAPLARSALVLRVDGSGRRVMVHEAGRTDARPEWVDDARVVEVLPPPQARTGNRVQAAAQARGLQRGG